MNGLTYCNYSSLISLCFAFLLGCATTAPSSGPDPGSGILEAVEEGREEGRKNNVGSVHYTKLMELFASQGYQGLGLEYESEESLMLLYEIFSDKAAQNLRLRLIYTGLKMSYDDIHQSLTVGGFRTKKEVLDFMKKNISKRKDGEFLPPSTPTIEGPVRHGESPALIGGQSKPNLTDETGEPSDQQTPGSGVEMEEPVP